MQRYTLIYVLGTGHSGSTLLDLLLNGHPQVLGLGEISRLRGFAHGKDFGTMRVPLSQRRTEVRMEPLVEEPFWQAVQRECTQRYGRRLDELEVGHPSWRQAARWTDTDVARWGALNSSLLDCVHRVTGAQIITDTSKSAPRLYLLDRCGQFNLKVIHLTRDGRAVISAYLEKGRNFWAAYRIWASSRLRAIAMRQRFDVTEWIDVNYETLCATPRDVLHRLCEFLGLEFAEEMLAYRRHAYHGVGGNRMRVLNEQDERIVLDETWRERLPRTQRIAFDLMGGWVERQRTARRAR